jgi:hypothetical protein
MPKHNPVTVGLEIWRGDEYILSVCYSASVPAGTTRMNCKIFYHLLYLYSAAVTGMKIFKCRRISKRYR